MRCWPLACGRQLALPHRRQRIRSPARAVSSVGRASRLHREGRRFESVTAHQPQPPLRCGRQASPRRRSGLGRCSFRIVSPAWQGHTPSDAANRRRGTAHPALAPILPAADDRAPLRGRQRRGQPHRHRRNFADGAHLPALADRDARFSSSCAGVGSATTCGCCWPYWRVGLWMGAIGYTRLQRGPLCRGLLHAGGQPRDPARHHPGLRAARRAFCSTARGSGALQIAGVLSTLAGVAVVASKGDLHVLLTLGFNFGDLHDACRLRVLCALYAQAARSAAAARHHVLHADGDRRVRVIAAAAGDRDAAGLLAMADAERLGGDAVRRRSRRR